MPVMLAGELKESEMAEDMNQQNKFVAGLIFPAVTRGDVRNGVQVSEAHSQEHLDAALTEFQIVVRKLGVI